MNPYAQLTLTKFRIKNSPGSNPVVTRVYKLLVSRSIMGVFGPQISVTALPSPSDSTDDRRVGQVAC